MFEYFSNNEDNYEFYEDPEWELVYTTNREIVAEMYKANLEGAGIPVSILSQVDSTRMLTVGNLAIVKIYVPKQFFNSAKEIIDAINQDSKYIS
ncbi:MAG TPA: DUF2007 domain-containing protein [Bacteroidota bacterium]|nr:DUF2007 domain-containing protein [Candidatus Kapabacteria bacterium]HRS01016.1 DUF2007 domain-containing protein [Bacteroidota bacterium]